MIPEKLKFKLREIIKNDEELARAMEQYTAFGYARLSSEDEEKEDKDKESGSIIRQRKILETYGINVDFMDDGKSGSLADEDITIWREDTALCLRLEFKKRPSYVSLLKKIEEGKAIFAATNWDRWARTSIGQEASMLYARKKNNYMMVVEEGNDPISRRIHAMLAELYVENQRSKMNQSARVKFGLGLYYGTQRLYGYSWVEKHGFQTLFPSNDSETDLIRKLFEMAKKGHSVDSIRKELSLDWGFVKKNLSNPYHCGLIKNPDKEGEYGQGAHPALISLEEFNLVQKKLGNKEIKK